MTNRLDFRSGVFCFRQDGLQYSAIGQETMTSIKKRKSTIYPGENQMIMSHARPSPNLVYGTTQ